MPSVLHILKADSTPFAATVIDTSSREPDTQVTVVLLHGAAAPSLPAGIAVRRISDGDLDYAGLLDLIFAADRVVTW
jgi:hypothetical protein